jgi:uncharacterized protein involved in exopolysaccharide biosynthesis
MALAPTAPRLRHLIARPARLISVVFRRKWLILGLFAITTATVLVTAFATPLQYDSTGRVLIKRGEQESVLTGSRQALSWEEDLASEVEVVRSSTVIGSAQEVLDRAHAAGGPNVRVRASQLNVAVVGQSKVIEITYLDRDPEVAHRACDAVINAYVEHRKSTANLTYPKQFFDGEIANVTAALDRWTTMRRNFSSGAGVSDLGEQRRDQLGRLSMLEENRTTAAADLAEAQSGVRMMNELQKNPDVDLPGVSAGYLNEGAVTDLKRRLVEQETKVAELRARYRDDAPDVVAAENALQSMKEILKREVGARLEMSQTRVQGIAARLQVIDHDIASVRADLASMPSKEMTLSEIDREIDVLRVRYRDLVQNSDQARISQQNSSTIYVLVLAPASAGAPQNTRDYVRLALAPVFSLVVGVGVACFVDGLDTRMRSVGEVEESLDMPVLASITERRRRSG